MGRSGSPRHQSRGSRRRCSTRRSRYCGMDASSSPRPLDTSASAQTIDGVSYPLPRPFMVMATQNPIEYEGTYPLPEAQLDRFSMRLSLGYPPLADEAKMLAEQTSEPPLDSLEPVCGKEQILQVIE